MRPTVRYLENELIIRIIDEAVDVLCKAGVQIPNDDARTLLHDHGATVDTSSDRVYFTNSIIEKALGTIRGDFTLYDSEGNQTHDFGGNRVHFTPGSAALLYLDHQTQEARSPVTADYIRYAKVVSQLPHIAAQSTAMIPADVHTDISDSYRLFLSLLYCKKPVVTGVFRSKSFQVMKDFQVAISGGEEALRQKPLTMFTCCPTTPLKWEGAAIENLLDCAASGIPVELVSMPMAGFISPVTVVGTLVQHTAEVLSGLVIAQLAAPGTALIWGSSASQFDIRHETAPLGAAENMILDCGINEIGTYLGLPTQAYIGLSDAKLLDAQAGLETAMGATMAVLAGINSISGPGMMDNENCHSIEKLIVDNEIAGMALRLTENVQPKDDLPTLPLIEELLRDDHLLISDHSLKYQPEHVHYPGPVIERANRMRWLENGATTLGQRANDEVNRLVDDYTPHSLSEDIRQELTALMEHAARQTGMDRLPERA